MHWMIRACAVALIMLPPTLARAEDDEDDAASARTVDEINAARRGALTDAEKAVDEARRVVRCLKRRKGCPAPAADPDQEE